MKHFLRYSLMCVLSILWGTAFAQTEVKFDFDNGDAALFGLPGVSCNADEANGIAESHDGDFTQDATATKDGVSITVSAAEEGAKNANRIWNKSAVLRMYSGSLTIEAPGHKITKLVINYSKDKWQADSKPDVGAFISSTDQTTIWSGSSSKVVIKIAGNSQMKDITVTLDGESGGQGSGDTNYGTAEAPLTVAEALTIATALEADAKTPDDVDVYTKGVVTEITTAWSSQYNNVSFNISNDGGTINLLVYRCKSEAEDYVLVGDEVIIKGKLKNYKGNTPEYDAGCEIVSLVPGDGHDTTPHTDVKFDFDNGDAALFGLPGVSCNADEANGIAESHDGDFTQDATATKDGVSITVSAAEEGAKNANRIWNKSAVLRMYSGSLTIEAPERTITKVVINYSKDKWQADSKPDVGEFTSSTNQTTIWEGSSSKIVIKIAGNSQMKDITVTLDGESGGQGGGDTNYGTAEAPLTVAEALAIATALEDGVTTTEDVYTKGVVTEITTAWSSQYNNVSFNISNDGGTTNLLVYRCKSSAADYVLVGDEVIIKGKLKNYRGDTPEYDAGCEIVSLVQGEGHQGSVPETPEEIDVAKALQIIDALEDGKTTDKEYIVTGKVVSIEEISTSYGNATFIIADENDASAQIKVFRAKGYNNEMITDEAFIKEGDKVVVIGKLQKYVKNDVVTPEISSCYIKSIETATGIQNVKISKANGAIYNLAGQQVEKATKGIYIQNGRKFVVK
ncbi:MAG: hypothetical protein IJ885_05320 [Prevotella sp.]|nr:hypothetical protein [Prevotella sp.]